MRASEFIVEYQEVDEGWKEVAVGGALALGALGSTYAKMHPTAPTSTPTKQVVQQKQFTPLGNNPQNEMALLKTAKASGMKGPELAQFMAQTKHESWDFNRLKEKSQPGVKGYFTKKYDIKYAPKTAKILGNKKVGDGEKYHGRGFIQLTGRDNYRMAGEALNIDLLNNPELAANPEVASKIALWYWNSRVKPHVQNFNDTSAVTRKINPAGKGLEDRQSNFKDYMSMV
jgi:predicted chitinase